MLAWALPHSKQQPLLCVVVLGAVNRPRPLPMHQPCFCSTGPTDPHGPSAAVQQLHGQPTGSCLCHGPVIYGWQPAQHEPAPGNPICRLPPKQRRQLQRGPRRAQHCLQLSTAAASARQLHGSTQAADGWGPGVPCSSRPQGRAAPTGQQHPGHGSAVQQQQRPLPCHHSDGGPQPAWRLQQRQLHPV